MAKKQQQHPADRFPRGVGRYVPTESLIPYENNPRKNDRTVIELAEEIQRNGFNKPVICNLQNVILAGHTAWKAAVYLKIPEIPAWFIDRPMPNQNSYRINDNLISEKSQWDKEKFLQEVENDPEVRKLVAMAEQKLAEMKMEVEARKQDKEEKPEMEFSHELMLEHNYVVVYFDNPFDWQNAMKELKLGKVKNGIKTEGSQKVGQARVFPGKKLLDMLKGKK